MAGAAGPFAEQRGQLSPYPPRVSVLVVLYGHHHVPVQAQTVLGGHSLPSWMVEEHQGRET